MIYVCIHFAFVFIIPTSCLPLWKCALAIIVNKSLLSLLGKYDDKLLPCDNLILKYKTLLCGFRIAYRAMQEKQYFPWLSTLPSLPVDELIPVVLKLYIKGFHEENSFTILMRSHLPPCHHEYCISSCYPVWSLSCSWMLLYLLCYRVWAGKFFLYLLLEFYIILYLLSLLI